MAIPDPGTSKESGLSYGQLILGLDLSLASAEAQGCVGEGDV
jgi:hypothetical protein